MRFFLVGLALFAGCYDSSGVQCGTLLCPHGDVCAPMEDRCVSPGQVLACEGAAEGAGCTAGTVSAGLCHVGVCIDAGCGNAVVEPGEVCDDGNRVSLDGCSSDCHSDERCGNGILDVTFGEQCDTTANSDSPGATCRTDCRLARCGDGVVDPGEWCDDGNTTAGDGCRADCTGRFTEIPSGTLKSLNAVWGASPTDVYAVGDHRIVHFDGVHWTAMELPLIDAFYTGVCGTSATNVYVLAVVGTGTIWRWNGTRWTNVHVGNENPKAITCTATDLVAAASTAGSAGLVEFWDGSAWTPTPNVGAPTKVFARSRNDVWVTAISSGVGLQHWDGTSWTQAFAQPPPSPILGGSQSDVFVGQPTYRVHPTDSTLQVDADEIIGTTFAGIDGDVLMVGSGGPDFAAAAMQFDGTRWTLLPMPSLPQRRLNAAWVYAPGRAFVVGDYGTILY